MSNDFLKTIKVLITTQMVGKDKYFDSLPDPPLGVYQAFHELGVANWWIPKQYGGHGLSLEKGTGIVEELAYQDAGVAFTLFIPILSSTVIALFGTEAQKDRFLRPMTGAGACSAMLGSERAAGSELLNITTTAQKDGDSYVLNGQKFFATNAEFADPLVVLAATPKGMPPFKMFLVPKGTPGVTMDRRWPVIGVRASATYQVSLENCRIPSEFALDYNGLRLLEVGLNPSRILMATSAIGIGRRIRDLCLEYGREKQIKKERLLDNAVFAAKIGQMEMELDVMRSACITAARQFDKISSAPDAREIFLKTGSLKEAVVAKMACGQLGWRIATVGSEMFGGLGYTDDMIIGKLIRDIRYVSIVEGGDDVLRELLYRRHVLPTFVKGG
jgi:alkylation response protein AidB-like acyl-CoA dehydrogenase